MSHTPGPWSLVHALSGPITVLGGSSDANSIARVVEVKTWPNCGPEIQEQAEANARLIAAAPDLLAALEHCSDWFSAAGYENLPVIEQLRAAIAKAKGQA